MEHEHKNGTVKWIIGLCVVTVIAVIGWTTMFNLSQRLAATERLNTALVELQAITQNNIVRISVLENKYSYIEQALRDIKELLERGK